MAVPHFRPGEAESPLKRARGLVRAGEPALKDRPSHTKPRERGSLVAGPYPSPFRTATVRGCERIGGGGILASPTAGRALVESLVAVLGSSPLQRRRKKGRKGWKNKSRALSIQKRHKPARSRESSPTLLAKRSRPLKAILSTLMVSFAQVVVFLSEQEGWIRPQNHAAFFLHPFGVALSRLPHPGFRFAPPMGYDPAPLRGSRALSATARLYVDSIGPKGHFYLAHLGHDHLAAALTLSRFDFACAV